MVSRSCWMRCTAFQLRSTFTLALIPLSLGFSLRGVMLRSSRAEVLVAERYAGPSALPRPEGMRSVWYSGLEGGGLSSPGAERPRSRGVWGLRMASDKELSREEKRKKYQALFADLTKKAMKLPPGPSKAQYLAKARNAKAMAKALAYKGGGEAEADEERGAKESGTGEPPKSETVKVRRVKKSINYEIKFAEPDMAPQLTEVVNWAYRGKEGKEGWTGEMDFIDGVRISQEDMETELDAGKSVILVAVSSGNVIGSIKVEKAGKGVAEIGMFAVDPDMQSNGIGRALFDAAEEYAVEMLDAKKLEMMVLDNRKDIQEWYNSLGYHDTEETMPFPTGANVGKPKMDLQFMKLVKTLNPEGEL